MGAWDTKIFGDDTACDVRDCYRELIEDGVDDAEAMRKTLDEPRNAFGKSRIYGGRSQQDGYSQKISDTEAMPEHE